VKVLDFLRQTETAGTGELVLEHRLNEMARYGKVHLMLHDSGMWSCSVDVTVNAVGAKFEVKADYGKHKSPSAAAAECHARILDAINNIGVKIK
jgi:hypothetical protein